MAEDDDLLIRQVQEEMRRERYEKLWQQYGTYAVAGAVAIVVGVGGFKFWQGQAQAAREAAGASFIVATQQLGEDRTAKAAEAFAAIASDGAGGYKTLAQLQLAAANLKLDKRTEASAALESVAAGGVGDPLMRDFAKLQSTALKVGKADFTEVENRLNDLLKADNPWRHSARELLGLSALKAGKLGEARKAFSALLGDREVPASLRQRAQVLMANVIAADLAVKNAAGGAAEKGKASEEIKSKSDQDESDKKSGTN